MSALPPRLDELLSLTDRTAKLRSGTQAPGAASANVQASLGAAIGDNGLSALQETLDWLIGLTSWPPSCMKDTTGLEPLKGPWGQAAKLLREAASRVRTLVGVRLEPTPLDAESKLHNALQDWVKELQSLSVGSSTLIPVVWSTGPPPRRPRRVRNSVGGPIGSKDAPGATPGQPADMPLPPSHVALLVVRRTTHDSGTLAVVNPLGSGSEYHVQRLKGQPTLPDMCGLPAKVGVIDWRRLCSASFWLLVMRPALTHLDDTDPWPAQLYEVLLPFLTKQKRSLQAAAQFQECDDDPDWTRLPSSDVTRIHLLLDGLALALRGGAATAGVAAAPSAGMRAGPWVVLLLKWEALRQGLASTADLPPLTVREACCSLARTGSALVDLRGQNLGGEKTSSGNACVWQARLLEQMHDWFEQRLEEVARAAVATQILPDAPKTWRAELQSCFYGGFDRFAEDVDVAALAGIPERPDVALPMPLVQVSQLVSSYHEAVAAVQRCVKACALLANQRHLVAHADLHAAALVTHLFSEVLPVPLRRCPRQQKSCFWRQEAMKRETQLALVAELAHLVRHFVAASLSLPWQSERPGVLEGQGVRESTHLRASRMLTLAAAVAILDAVLRRVPSDAPADLSRVFSGQMREGVVCPGFTMAPFTTLAEETRELCLADPVAMQLRTNLLDYFTSASPPASDANAADLAASGARSILGFEGMCLGAGDLEFLHRLALLRGFARGGQADRSRLSAFFAGQVPEFLACFPGLAPLRDTVFFLRLFSAPQPSIMTTLGRTRGDGGAWRAGDVELRWEADADGRLRAFGFQRALALDAHGCAPMPDDDGANAAGSLLSSFFGMAQKSSAAANGVKVRGLMSPANPSDMMGQAVKVEDDVLHAPELPTFGGKLTQGESEQLLVTLTAPYLRVPLVLQFFNNAAHFAALSNRDLQALVDAALFEPGSFRPDGPMALSRGLGEQAPLPMTDGPLGSDVAHATAAGRLVHELVNSPGSVLPALDGIFRLAMERDTPSFTPAATSVLFATRLWARCVAFVHAIVRCSTEAKAFPAECGDATGDRFVEFDSLRSACTRGFSDARSRVETLRTLQERGAAWEMRLKLEAIPTLERWCSRAMEAGSTQEACAIWLHLAFIYRWEPVEKLTAHAVSTLVCAEVFLSANLQCSNVASPAAAAATPGGAGTAQTPASTATTPGAAGSAQTTVWQRAELMGLLDTQIYELFHSTRPRIYRWLQREFGDRSRVLEHVVSVVASSQVAQHLEEATVLGRRWIELEECWDGSGRFAPSAPNAAAADAALAEEDFAQWLAASVDPAPVEVNLNVGQLQFRAHTVSPVPADVLAVPEFRELFPNTDVDAAALMWAMVERTPNRTRFRFAGLRYEFRIWSAMMERSPERKWSRSFPSQATLQETWIIEAIKGQPALQGMWSGPSADTWLAPAKAQTGDIAWLYAGSEARGEPDAPRAWRELELFRRAAVPGAPKGAVVVHVYETVMCGPRFVRTQIFTSSPAWSYCADPQPVARALPRGASPRPSFNLSGTDPVVPKCASSQPKPNPGSGSPKKRLATGVRAPLLEIVHEDLSGESVLVPHRFLAGALPDCLLDSFEFWRARPGRIVGKLTPAARREAPVPVALVIHLNDAGSAHCQRFNLDATSRTEEAKQVDRMLHMVTKEVAVQGDTLIDILRASPSSGGFEVARWAMQLDDLSQVLVWVHGQVICGTLQNDQHRPRIDAVEFPRLGLTFSSAQGEDSGLRCDQHRGLRVVAGGERTQDPRLVQLLRPFPRFVFLEDSTGEELYVLVSIADRPSGPELRGGGVTLVRNDPEWLSALRKDFRHHLFTVHASYEFLSTPTLAGQLHLMLLRIFSGMYREACGAVLACMAFGLASEPEEQLLWHEIVQALRDDPCMDAVVLRLKFMLALHNRGQGAPDGWDAENDLQAWTLHGAQCSMGVRLTPVEDKALLDLINPSCWRLQARIEIYNELLCLRGDSRTRGYCILGKPRDPGLCIRGTRINPIRSLPCDRGRLTIEDARDISIIQSDPNNTDDTQFYLTIVEEEEQKAVDEAAPGTNTGSVGFDRTLGGTQARIGIAAVPFLLQLLPPRLPHDFPLLYELATGQRTVLVTFNDDPALISELLIRMLPPDDIEANPIQAGILRALQAHPEIARDRKFPKFQRDEEFVHLLMKAFHDEKDVFEILPDVIRHNSFGPPIWGFKVQADGSWMSRQVSPDVEDVSAGDASAHRQVSEDSRRVSFHIATDAIRAEGPLTSPRLMMLLDSLRCASDLRLPSCVWDFDCEQRVLGEERSKPPTPSGALDGGFLTPRSTSTAFSLDGHADEEVAGLGGILRQMAKRTNLSPLLPALDTNMLKSLLLASHVSWTNPSEGASGETIVLGALEPNSGSKIGDTPASRSLLGRLRQDSMFYNKQRAALPCLLGLSADSVAEVLADGSRIDEKMLQVNSLLQSVNTMLSNDRQAVLEAVRITVELANGVGNVPSTETQQRCLQQQAQRLGQLGGSLTRLSFQDVMQLLLVRGGVETLLPHLNPLVTTRSASDAATACAVAMLLSTRTIVCRRSVVQLTRLLDLLLQARSKPRDTETELGHAIVEAAEQAAQELTTKQYSVSKDSVDFDPRLLCFEFISRVVLRKKQVELVRDMTDSVNSGKPLVHQMLMGQGKTTVVTPLVCLLTATAERVCVVCTPMALLEFTIHVLRERLTAALERPVVLFKFARSTVVSDDLYSHLLHVRDARAVLCAGPTALKSLILRFLLTIHDLDILRSREQEKVEIEKNQTTGAFLSKFKQFIPWTKRDSDSAEMRVKELKCEAQVLGWAAKIFSGAVLLLDDIDLLMHPLRSELHWPLGEQHELDFTAPLGMQGQALTTGGGIGAAGAQAADTGNATDLASYVAGSPDGSRWQIAFHLLDALYSCQLPAGPAVTTFSSQPEAVDVLRCLRNAVAAGLDTKQLQAAPHLVLISTDFYHTELKPLFAEWLLLWLRRRTPVPIPDDELKKYLCAMVPEAKHRSFRDLGDHQMKALNLSRTWLAVLLPHIASRTHRVHYGLLDEKAVSWAGEPRARRHFAVPFVGKDAPSDTSQFSHPDVVIGLTWLAHRLGGLREGDFLRALRLLCRMNSSEADVAARLRQATRFYCAWVTAAGAHVRGDVGSDASPSPGTVAAAGKSGPGGDISALGRQGTFSSQSGGRLVLQDSRNGEAAVIVPPLEWLDVRDEMQVAIVGRVLRASPFLVEFYLHEAVYPQLLRHADAKLSATGQDLGSEVLCGSRLGFSGTPNDLLPRALGRCAYALGDDTKMLRTLTDPAVVEVWPVGDGWGARSLLEEIANARPAPNALIDVGALITGFSNEEVAQVLLDAGLPFEAVVFCEPGGEQLLLTRGRPEPVKLSHCALPPERRFVFYDQVHTTGIDIRHSPSARAVLTLGKDSTFRDYAQGAYRMRGIGRGQRLRVLLTPEVGARVKAEVPSLPAAPSSPSGPIQAASMVSRLCAWLLVRQAATEHVQQQLLKRQAIAHEGRRCAYEHLRAQAQLLVDEGVPWKPEADSTNEKALDLFRERVDYAVETGVVGHSGDAGATGTLKAVADRVKSFLDHLGDDQQRQNGATVEERRRMLHDAAKAVEALLSSRRAQGAPEERGDERPVQKTLGDALATIGEEEKMIFAEEEQEHEQELFAEQEQEKEQEEEEEMEEEREVDATEEASTLGRPWQNLKRDEPPEAWDLDLLSRPPDDSSPFYPASRFELPSQKDARQEVSVSAFPPNLLVSRNFHRPGRGKVPRRLRAPAVILDWMPGEASHSSTAPSPSSTSVGPALLARVKLVLELLGLGPLAQEGSRPANISVADAERLLAALGVAASSEEAARVAAAVNEEICRTEGSRPRDFHEVVVDGLNRIHALQPELGRFYVLLTLAEAEAVRMAMHLHNGGGGIVGSERGAAAGIEKLSRSVIALRVLSREPLGLRTLDASAAWKPAALKRQDSAVAEMLCFLAAESLYGGAEIEGIWQSLRRGAPHGVGAGGSPGGGVDSELLRDFFLASYALRRRFPQPPLWQELPVARLFSTESEHQQEQREASLREAHLRMLDLGWLPAKAFAVLDRDKDDKVVPGDFNGTGVSAADALGLPARLLPRLFEALDRNGTGYFTAEAWAAAFEGRENGIAPTVASSTDPIRPPNGVPLDVLRCIAIELVSHTAYTSVWTSEGTKCRRHVSIWAPDQLVSGYIRVTAKKLSIGHYANQGFSDARGGNRSGVGARLILQVRDKSWSGSATAEYLSAVADHYCPCPVKFRQVWSQRSGKQPLFIWRPTPPSEAFVSLGMVATVTPEPPPVTCVRCVPKSFCRFAEKAPAQIWDDGGMGGKAASIWAVNAPQVLWVAPGHQAPQETFWELVSDTVTFDYTGRPSVQTVVQEPDNDVLQRNTSTNTALVRRTSSARGWRRQIT